MINTFRDGCVDDGRGCGVEFYRLFVITGVDNGVKVFDSGSYSDLLFLFTEFFFSLTSTRFFADLMLGTLFTPLICLISKSYIF